MNMINGVSKPEGQFLRDKRSVPDATPVNILQEENLLNKKKLFNQYVKANTPKHSSVVNIANAFWVGGIICVIGQLATNLYRFLGANKEDAALFTVLTLILLSVILTSLGWYAKIAKFAGAGTVVPITGFANSVASTAIEYKKEGQVFGIGCQIFSIAGPVILYGVFASWCLGLIYWFITLL